MMVNEIFKKKWNEVDKRCPTCNQITERSRGLTKQNLKRLITPRFDFNELMITLFLILVIFAAFSYKSEIAMCQGWMYDMANGTLESCHWKCTDKCNKIHPLITAMHFEYNASQLNFTDYTNWNEGLNKSNKSP